MQDFRKLRVWQSAQLLAVEIHSLVTFARCLRIAMGSLAETESLLDFAIQAGWVPTRDHDHLIGLITATRRRLIRLLQTLTKS